MEIIKMINVRTSYALNASRMYVRIVCGLKFTHVFGA